jgi:hypothetical protein
MGLQLQKWENPFENPEIHSLTFVGVCLNPETRFWSNFPLMPLGLGHEPKTSLVVTKMIMLDFLLLMLWNIQLMIVKNWNLL